jgi:uncharacterized membrane protein YvbJ
MVYCHNCGTKNEDDAEFCSKCGEPLKDVRDYDDERYHRRHHRDDRYYRQRQECFGLPHGNIIGPLIGGIILILIGVSAFTGFEIWQYFWQVIVIILGVLIIVGAIYGAMKRKK